MRKLAVLTTTAVMALCSGALCGAAQAQSAGSTPVVALAAHGSPQTATLQSAVSAYAAFHADLTDLRTLRVNASADLETALDRAARHNRDDMTRGWVAYGALTAAQSPTFVQGVRDAAAYYGRDAVIWAVTADPAYARGLRGGNEATRLVLDTAAADSARIINVADRYQEMAYGLQHQRWANAVAPAQAQRLLRVRALGAPGSGLVTVADTMSPRLAVTPLSLTPLSDPTAFGGRRFWDTLNGGANVTEVSAQVSYQWRINDTRGEAIDRMASIAALQALNAADDHQSAVSQLMNDPRSRDCFEMAQLQLYQCMSAAHFRYENAFCLGQHGLRDVGLCIGAVALPDASAMTPINGGPIPAPTTRRQ